MHALNDQALIDHTKKLITSERKITSQILEALEEIERRRLYLERGYPSLFAFCTECLGYSASSAQRRISSMRLIKKLPAEDKTVITQKLESGELNLSHISLVSQTKQTTEKSVELLAMVQSKSTHECEKILAKEVGFELKREKLKSLNETKTQLTVTLDQETVELLEQFKNITAAQNPQAEIAITLKLALKSALAKSKSVSKRTSAPAVTSRYIPKTIRSEIRTRDQNQCQYIDPQTQKKCDSKFNLHFDHIKPRALGGLTTQENLRLLCANHNRYLGRKLLEQL